MSWSLPVVNPLEESINNQVSALVGNNDVNLKTIIKMSIMNDMFPNVDNKEIIKQMEENNKMETFLIEKEYQLTYDMAGNLIPIECINEGKESQKDPQSVIPKSEGSK